MNIEQVTDYLEQGGTDQQYVLESIQEWTSDHRVVDVISVLFRNYENED